MVTVSMLLIGLLEYGQKDNHIWFTYSHYTIHSAFLIKSNNLNKSPMAFTSRAVNSITLLLFINIYRNSESKPQQ